MFQIDPKSGFWSLKCECKSIIQMTGEKILKADVITCPNCGNQPNLPDLKDAVTHLLSFISSINKATSRKATYYLSWTEITPHGFNEPLKAPMFNIA